MKLPGTWYGKLTSSSYVTGSENVDAVQTKTIFSNRQQACRALPEHAARAQLWLGSSASAAG